mmetsp:Transcript_27843/g.84974  ORF Transcript_27843/g.84974 Transcript_27843/m.84974 type:complete len:110 (-) Transcript_27843:1007-1336(-)
MRIQHTIVHPFSGAPTPTVSPATLIFQSPFLQSLASNRESLVYCTYGESHEFPQRFGPCQPVLPARPPGLPQNYLYLAPKHHVVLIGVFGKAFTLPPTPTLMSLEITTK